MSLRHIICRPETKPNGWISQKYKTSYRLCFTHVLYLKIGLSYSLHYRLILSRMHSFCLVFNLIYRSKTKLNGWILEKCKKLSPFFSHVSGLSQKFRNKIPWVFHDFSRINWAQNTYQILVYRVSQKNDKIFKCFLLYILLIFGNSNLV